MAKDALLEALDAASAADLERVETEIKTQTKRLDSLKAVAKVLRLKINGKDTTDRMSKMRRAWALKKGRKAVAKHLVRGGRGTPTQIAQALSLDPDLMPEILDSPWFENTPTGINVTAEGRREGA